MCLYTHPAVFFIFFIYQTWACICVFVYIIHVFLKAEYNSFFFQLFLCENSRKNAFVWAEFFVSLLLTLCSRASRSVVSVFVCGCATRARWRRCEGRRGKRIFLAFLFCFFVLSLFCMLQVAMPSPMNQADERGRTNNSRPEAKKNSQQSRVRSVI